MQAVRHCHRARARQRRGTQQVPPRFAANVTVSYVCRGRLPMARSVADRACRTLSSRRGSAWRRPDLRGPVCQTRRTCRTGTHRRPFCTGVNQRSATFQTTIPTAGKHGGSFDGAYLAPGRQEGGRRPPGTFDTAHTPLPLPLRGLRGPYSPSGIPRGGGAAPPAAPCVLGRWVPRCHVGTAGRVRHGWRA
jgi:hypothetical protein